MDTNNRCEVCRFWKPGNPDIDGGAEGECLRYPPVLIPSLMEANRGQDGNNFTRADEAARNVTSWGFPRISFDEWCGEFSPVDNIAELTSEKS